MPRPGGALAVMQFVHFIVCKFIISMRLLVESISMLLAKAKVNVRWWQYISLSHAARRQRYTVVERET